MDRIQQLRSVFPELTENQARMMLCMCYETIHRTSPNLPPDKFQLMMDKATEGLCNSSIEKIGELLEVVP
jgi:hypothetical protein